MADARRHDRRVHHTPLGDDEGGAVASAATGERTDLARALATLRPVQRQMVWLAYVQGASHAEIAEALGLKAASIRLLLFRARKQLARFLRGEG
jgi:RNA polymerase sigma-70 factor (ECF subfamily)